MGWPGLTVLGDRGWGGGTGEWDTGRSTEVFCLVTDVREAEWQSDCGDASRRSHLLWEIMRQLQKMESRDSTKCHESKKKSQAVAQVSAINTTVMSGNNQAASREKTTVWWRDGQQVCERQLTRPPLFGWTDEEWEREWHAVKGHRSQSYPRLLQRGHSICTWGARSTNWATGVAH